MCQQWFSILGLVLDVVGILTIAVEWRHTFERDVYMRQKRIERDYRKSTAESRGEKFDDDEDLEYTMWRPFQKLLHQDKRYRSRLFYIGMGLIVMGFVLQTLGSWPYGIFGIKNC
jgi:hypothetical protein